MPHLKLKRHYKLLMLLTLLLVVLVVAAGDQPIVAYSVRQSDQVTESIISC